MTMTLVSPYDAFGGGLPSVPDTPGHGEYNPWGPGPAIYNAQDVFNQNRRDVHYYSGSWRYGYNPSDPYPDIRFLGPPIVVTTPDVTAPPSAITQAVVEQPITADPTINEDLQQARLDITNFYRTILDREPDEGGLAFWLDNLLNRGGTLDTIRSAFVTSQEASELYGLNQTVPPNNNDASVVPTPPSVSTTPISFMDLFNSLTSGNIPQFSIPTPSTPSQPIVVPTPYATSSEGGFTKMHLLLIILAVLGGWFIYKKVT